MVSHMVREHANNPSTFNIVLQCFKINNQQLSGTCTISTITNAFSGTRYKKDRSTCSSVFTNVITCMFLEISQ